MSVELNVNASRLHDRPRNEGAGQNSRLRRMPLQLALVAGVLAPAAHAQFGNLKDKLKELNVRLTTEHYVLAGTVTDKRLDMYGQALEYVYREYEAGFSELLEDEQEQECKSGKKKSGRSRSGRRADRSSRRGGDDEPAEQRTMDQEDDQNRFPVIVFKDRREYLEFGAAFLAGAEHSIGMYVPSCKLLLILDQGNFDDTYEVLFHEAFHQFIDRYIADPPIWVNEGLAVHYGNGRPTASGLSFRRPPALWWQLVRKLIQKKQAVPLWDVVSADRRAFYSSIPVKVSGFDNVTLQSIYYAEAYTLVHTLMSDRSGRERLRDYLRDLADDDGRHTAQITREYFGPEVCEHMTSFWVDHVNSRPETR